MNIDLKRLSLAFAAVLVVSAMATTTAEAVINFTANEYPATGSGTGEQKIGEGKAYFEAIGRKIECEVVHASGTLAGPSSDLTITADITDHTQGGNCRAGGTLVTTVTENGCVLTGTALSTKEGGKSYNVGVDLVCPAGKVATLHVRNLLNSEDACTITAAPQTVIGNLTAANNGAHVDVSGAVQIASVIDSNNTALCGVEKGTSKEVVTGFVTNEVITIKSPGKSVAVSD
jgi:hypothetical protein